MSRIIVVTSGRGGVGKTSISINLASEFALRKYRTCLFDADSGPASVDILLGLEPSKTLDDFFRADISLTEIVRRAGSGLDIISGGLAIEKAASLTGPQVRRLVDGFSQLADYDFLIIDTCSGLSRSVVSFCLAALEIVLVITSESASLTDAYALLKVLAAHQYAGIVKILVSKSAGMAQAKETYVHFKSVVYRHLQLEIAPAGVVVFDDVVEQAGKRRQPFISSNEESPAAECIRTIAGNLLRGENVPDEDSNDLGRFWARFFDINNSLDGPQKDDGTGGTAEAMPGGEFSLEQDAGGESTGVFDRSMENPAEKGTVRFDVEFHNLPTPRPLLSQILFLNAEGKLTLERLCTIISADPVLYGRVLQLYYALNHTAPVRGLRVSDIISELGVPAVVDLVLSVAMQHGLLANPQGQAVFVNHFCLHSLACAMLARKIAEAVGYLFPEEAYLAGLFMDLGKLALHVRFPRQSEAEADLFMTFRHDGESARVEHACAGMNHAELGGAIVANLHCNSFVVDAVRFHAEDESQVASGFELVRIAYLAHTLAIARGDARQSAVELAASFFDLPSAQVIDICADVHREVENFADEFALAPTHRLGSFEERREESPEQFRRRVVDYAMIQGIMPKPFSPQDENEALKRIFQNLYLMFGVDEAFLMVPARGRNHLQAIGYHGSFCEEMLAQLQLGLDARKSMVVQTFRNGSFIMAPEKELNSVADRQLLGLLGRQYLVAFPVLSLNGCDGVILFAVSEEKAGAVWEQEGRLVQFGAQISAILAQFDWR